MTVRYRHVVTASVASFVFVGMGVWDGDTAGSAAARGLSASTAMATAGDAATPITGSQTPRYAPVLKPGRYASVINGDGSTAYYAIAHLADDAVTVSATLPPPTGDVSYDADAVSLALTTTKGVQCAVGRESRIDRMRPSSLFTTYLTYEPAVAVRQHRPLRVR